MFLRFETGRPQFEQRTTFTLDGSNSNPTCTHPASGQRRITRFLPSTQEGAMFGSSRIGRRWSGQITFPSSCAASLYCERFA